MEVIKNYPENLSKRDVYKMTKSPDVHKMSDAEGSVLEVVAWVIYNDADNKTGEIKEVVTIMTADGEMFGTISPTFIKEFKDIAEYFGADVGNIKVIGGVSQKNGRNYITCSVD